MSIYQITGNQLWRYNTFCKHSKPSFGIHGSRNINNGQLPASRRVLTWTKCVHRLNVFYHNWRNENGVEPFSKHVLVHILPPPLCLFILPSFYLSDSPSTPPPVPPSLLRELICRNIPAAHCDHLVNTPIILSASASPSHPAEEMTPRGWQFNLPVTDGSYRGGRGPFLLTFFFVFFSPAKRCCLSASRRSPLSTPAGASSPHHHRRSSGEGRCHSFMWPCQYPATFTRSAPPCIYQTNDSSIATPPLLISLFFIP